MNAETLTLTFVMITTSHTLRIPGTKPWANPNFDLRHLGPSSTALPQTCSRTQPAHALALKLRYFWHHVVGSYIKPDVEELQVPSSEPYAIKLDEAMYRSYLHKKADRAPPRIGKVKMLV